MQRIQRKVGRFMPNRAPNEADIEAMLHDFNDSDKMLENIENAAKQWRDAWTNILAHQLATIEHMHSIYKPLGARSPAFGKEPPVETPESTLQRCAQLEQAFDHLKHDMMEEVADIDKKLAIPAKLARDALKPMKKSIKTRDDKKVDYERYKGRCEALQRNTNRSDRDAVALNKHEADLARATQEYHMADEALRYQLPRLNAATFSLLPHLLTNQIILQNNLIGNLYTVLNQFSLEQGYPDPPPEPEEVIPVWEADFTPLRKELEADFEMLRTGKAIHQPMRLPDKGSTVTGLGLRNKVIPGRSVSSNENVPTVREPRKSFPSSPRPGMLSRPGSSRSDNGYGTAPPAYSEEPVPPMPPPVNLSSKPSFGNLSSKPSYGTLNSKPSYGNLTSRPKIGASPGGLTPTSADPWKQRRTSEASYASSNGTSHTGLSTATSHDTGREDYFGRHRIPSNASSAVSPNPALGKKKPPPPPPPKKSGSFQGEYVVAMYDFCASTQGDLTFREGDRIKVLKKTNSTQDWWEGEVNGVRGSFPANYCK